MEVSHSQDFHQTSKSERDAKDGDNEALVSRKRKAEDTLQPLETKRSASSRDSLSATYLPPCAKLPAQIWQRIFLSLSPEVLGRLLLVNRTFYSYLTDTSARPFCRVSEVPLRASESIWESARLSSSRCSPRPLRGCSELDMLRLANGRSCQFCGRLGLRNPLGGSPWNNGPGEEGVKVIWPFAIRSCGACLLKQCEKESSLLFSSAYSLLGGLPFIILTENLNLISQTIIESAGIMPLGLRISKWYLKRHVQEVKASLERAREHGHHSEEEWFKGLENSRKERLSDALRWEKWELSAGHSDKEDETTSSPSHHPLSPGILPSSHAFSPTASPSRYSDRSNSVLASTSTALLQITDHAQRPLSRANPKLDRSIEDVNEAKATRKDNIQKLCMELEPPIGPDILQHMESFKAALQITTPMTDSAWEVLKPRLLAQREKAEAMARSCADAKTSSSAIHSDRHSLEANAKELKETVDREWEDSQYPVRQKLASLTEKYIKKNWANGEGVNKENCHTFAAHALIHVRKAMKFEDENPIQADTQRSHSAESTSQDHGSKKLVLENMKWVFDHYIKPITEKHRKELFLCRVCESTSKYYVFEGIIQHYGAKHTPDFSVGNVVVHWKEAEWPTEPPFHPDPAAVKFSPYDYSQYYPGGFSRGNTSTPQLGAVFPYSLQTSPFAIMSNPSGNFHGPFPPPQAGQINYSGPNFPGALQALPGGSQHFPQGFNVSNYANLNQETLPPPSWPVQSAISQIQAPIPLTQPLNPIARFQNPELGESNATSGTDLTGKIDSIKVEEKDEIRSSPSSLKNTQKHIDELARLTKDAWLALSGVSSLQPNLRLFVTFQRVYTEFKTLFEYEPTLDLFHEALENDLLKVLVSLPPLSCSVCCSGNASSSSSHESFSNVYDDFPDLISLVSHFKQTHLLSKTDSVNALPSHLDWTKDMITIPDAKDIVALESATEMSDDVFQFFSEAFPDLFPSLEARKRERDKSRANEPRPTSAASVAKSRLGSKATSTPSPQSVIPQDQVSPEVPKTHQGREQVRSKSSPQRRRASEHNSPLYDHREPVFYQEQRIFRPKESYRGEYFNQEPWDYFDRYPVSYQVYRDHTPEYIPIQERHYRLEDPEDDGLYHDRRRLRERSPHRLAPTGIVRPSYEEATVPHTGEGTPAPDGSEDHHSYSENAAERFLNTFLPDKGDEDLWNVIEKNNHPVAEEAEVDWQSKKAHGKSANIPTEKDGDNARLFGQDGQESLDRSDRPSDPSLNVEIRQPSGRSYRMDSEARVADRPINSPYRRRNRYPEQVPSRFARYMPVYREDRPSYGHRVPRPQSRYQRYEEKRRELERQRSRTPELYRESDGDRASIREPSVDGSRPRPEGKPQSYPRERSNSYVRVEQQPRSAPGSYTSRYGYPERRPSTYVDDYMEPYQFVRVHDGRGPYGRYMPGYAEGSRSGHRIEFLPLERAGRAERYYDDKRYVYLPEHRQSRPEERPMSTREPESYHAQSVNPEESVPPATPVGPNAEAKS